MRASPRTRCRVLLTLAAAGLALPCGVHGQLLHFRRYGHAEGVPQMQILALLQDARGFLWLGSYGGLARFDGRGFTLLTTHEGLTSNTVTDLALDSTHTLVVGTTGGGVCFVSQASVECLGARSGLAGDNVASVLVSPEGGVWVGTDRGVSLLRDRKVARSYGVSDGLPSAVVGRLAWDSDGRLWASTSEGSVRLEGDRFVPDRAGVPGREPVTVLGSTSHGLVLTDPQGVFLEHDGATLRLAGPIDSVANVATDVAEDREGAVWIGTYAGALRYRGGRIDRLTTRNGLVDDRIDRVLVDREDDVWFGTEYGLGELVPGPFEFFSTESGLPHMFVTGLLQDRRGTIWVGTNSGIARWDGRRFRGVPLPAPATNVATYPMAEPPEGGILVGTLGEGLAWVRPSGTRVYGLSDGLPSLTIESLLADSDGVWVGTQGGVARWSRGHITIPRDSVLARTQPYSMMRDEQGRLWLGRLEGGVLIWDGERAEHRGRADGLTDQIVWDMNRAADGALWLGTNGDGALRVQGSRITRVSRASGLANDFVWQVQPDSTGDMWLFTNAGLDRLHGGAIRHYGPGEGLVDVEGTAGASIEDANGRLWFGTGSGVYRYDPSLAVSSTAPPPVYLESLGAGGSEYPLQDAVLPAGTRNLEVTFSSPTYRDRSALRFRYRLGEDDSWSAPQEEPRVSLAGLGPGTYTLQVMAENGAGLSSDPPAAVTFTIEPELWETWWFRVLGLLLFAGMIASIPWIRTRRLEREREALNRLVEQRTLDLEEKTQGLEREIAERQAVEAHRRQLEEQLHQAQKMEAIGRLAGGIAHDFNNLLTSVIGHAELLQHDLGDSPLQQDVQEIGNAARRGASLVSQLLAYSRQQIIRQELVDLNEEVESAARLLRRMIGDDIILRVEPAPEAAAVHFDRTQLHQVLSNLAVNAKDAMPSGGTLTFAVDSVDLSEPLVGRGPDDVAPGAYVTLAVHDTGLGMSDEVLERAFDPFFTTKDVGKGTGLGLATVYGSVHQSGGFVQAHSEEGRGTTFRLFLPRAEQEE